MKKKYKLTTLQLALLMVLALTACGGEKDVSGADWRTTGVVVGSGTITHDGDSVDVLVTVDSGSAAFYRDQEEQVLYDSVAFPFEITDAADAFTAIRFDDLNGDGETDVTIDFQHADQAQTHLVWIWDPVERYVLWSALSWSSHGVVPETPSFAFNELRMNGDVDGGRYLLENGAACYDADGSGYTLADCYWEVKKLRDETHDGLREIEFNACCYLPYETVPGTSECMVDSALYDYYTGTWLTASSSFPGAKHEENHYLHTIDYGGERYDIEFYYATESIADVGEWRYVLTKNYIAYLPADYDGLIFAAQAMPATYEENVTRANLDTIAPEAYILDCPTLDVHSSLYFAVCY